MVRSFETKANGGVPRNEVDQPAGDEKRRDLPRALFVQDDRGFGNAVQAANAGADQNSGCLPVVFGFRLPSGIVHRLLSGGKAVGDEMIYPTLLLRFQPAVGVEGTVRSVT